MTIRKFFKIAFSLIAVLVLSVSAIANENVDSYYKLYINHQYINSNQIIIQNNNKLLFPLRSVMETMGASITWNGDTNSVCLGYKNKTYTCFVRTLSTGRNSFFYIKNSDEQYVQLNPMGAAGGFEIIDDHIYLYRETLSYFLKQLQYTIEVDCDERIVNIFAARECIKSENDT